MPSDEWEYSRESPFAGGPWQYQYEHEFRIIDRVSDALGERVLDIVEGDGILDLDNPVHPPPAMSAWIEYIQHFYSTHVMPGLLAENPDANPYEVAKATWITSLGLAFEVGVELTKQGITLTPCKCSELRPEEASGEVLHDMKEND